MRENLGVTLHTLCGNYFYGPGITLRFLRIALTTNCPPVELTLSERTMRGLTDLPPNNTLP
ncbi:MAG: hypothetical protein NT138_18405 [Planctomycetales bacterium]|nr:hypothetical protein [Planctomycetales bacterium]